MSQPSDGMIKGEEQEHPQPSPKAAGWTLWLGWGFGIVALVFALAVLLWSHRQRQMWQGELTTLRQALASARQVFLKRASDELGYASVDLEGNLPNRYQASFRIGEALRWLQDAEPLLSPEGQKKALALRQTLSRLTVAGEQDPLKA
ncbi:MAG: hypothetical protein BKPUNTRY_000576, partial [Candidatus Fervidibacter sp.]